jgi:flagellar biosynthesis anti-sigma factor FlgM
MVDPVSFPTARPVDTRISAPANRNRPESLPAQRTATVSLGRLTAAARELAKAGPPVDYARIAQIRMAISQRDYKIDNDMIAKAMLHHFHSKAGDEGSL